MNAELVKCEVCGEATHGLADGSKRCEKHLPETAAKPSKRDKPRPAE